MNELSKWLQTNPLIVVIMFLVSLASGLAGLLLGWEQLYRDYLSKSVEIPVWLLLLAVLLLPAALAVSRRITRGPATRELQPVEGKKFGVQRLPIDGNAFDRCEFHGTELIFSGESGFSMNRCILDGSRLTFAGAAGLAVVMITKLYADPGLRPIVEGILSNIRSGVHPEAVAPTIR